MTRRTLVCCAHPFGYGPAAKLLHLVRAMRPAPWRLIFVGAGIAHELAARSRLFDEVVPLPASDSRVLDLLRSAAGVLSLMEREYAAAALALDRPLFVADSLLWMRDVIPPVFQQARRFWAQEFVGVRRRLPEVGAHAAVVGPIVGPASSVARERGTRLLVNLGGAESPLGGNEAAYAEFVGGALLELGLNDAVVLAGQHCIETLRSRFPNCCVEMRSAPHDEALALLRQAKCVLTAPGLTATLECFQIGVPTFFLPPQNYSQWWLLKKLREQGLAPGALHWEDLRPDCGIRERMPEDARAPLVRGIIRELARDERARRLLVEGLVNARGREQDDLVRRQRAFFDGLGPCGTESIVAELVRILA